MTEAEPGEHGDPVRCSHCNRDISVHASRLEESAQEANQPCRHEEEEFASAARKAMSKTTYLVAECDRCKRRLQVSIRQAGKKCRCPSCNHMLRVPFPGEQDEDDIDVEDTFPEDPQQDMDVMASAALEASSAGGTSRMPRRRVRARGSWRKPVVLAGGAFGTALILIVLLLSIGNRDNQVPAGQSSQTSAQLPAQPEVPLEAPDAARPETPPQPPVEPAGSDVPDPIASAQVRKVSTSMGVLLPGSRRPAALEKLYCLVTAGIRAGDEPVQVTLDAARLILEFDTDAVSAMGVLPQSDWRNRPTRSMEVQLAPQGYETVTILFEVPRTFRRGTLEVASLGQLEIDAEYQPAAMPLEGVYQESPPRHLKPLLRDPVMRAIQNLQLVHIEISAKADQSPPRVTLAEVELAGTAQAVSEDIYRLELSGPAGQLECHLRQVDGETLLLYLDASHYHQITLRKTMDQVTRIDGP
jgi:hypothetical protein